MRGSVYYFVWQISMLGGAFEQEGAKTKRVKKGGAGAGAGGTLQYVRGNYKSLKGTNLTVVARIHPFISPAWYYSYYFFILADLMLLIGVVYNTLFRCGEQRVKAS